MRDPEEGYWLVLMKAACRFADCMLAWRCCLLRCWFGAAQAPKQQGRGGCLGIVWRLLLGGLGGCEAARLPARCLVATALQRY